MAQQHINLGTPPTGVDGDNNRVGWQKAEANFNEIYGQIGAFVGQNLLFNAEGRINQVAFAGGALAAGVYGYDMWKAGAGGCNVSVDSTGLFSHVSGPLVQVVEAPNGVFGLPVTLSVEDPTGSISVSVGGVTGVITAGGGRRGVTLAIPSGSGNLTVQLTATGATYRRPQLVRGSAAVPFEYRPQGIELILCQRYYERRGLFFTAYNTGGATIDVDVPYTVPKRTTPALTWLSASFVNCGSLTGAVIETARMIARVTVTSTGSATLNSSWALDARL